MKFYRDLRQELIKEFRQRSTIFPLFEQMARTNPALYEQWMKGTGRNIPFSEYLDEMTVEGIELVSVMQMLENCKTIVFAREQAEVFLGLSQRISDSAEDDQRAVPLDFRIPFPFTFLQFSEAVPIQVWGSEDTLLGIALHQFEVNGDHEIYAAVEAARRNVPIFVRNGDLFNEIAMIFGDRNIRCLGWTSSHQEFMDGRPDLADEVKEGWDMIRTLAIACIGYINCVNVELVKEGEVAEKVNRKRLRDGKKLLEPYYLCRIKLESKRKESAKSNEAGIHHTFRYDVRGHFRRLPTGKTTWVVPHQRGLQHDLYIPKRLVV